MTFKIKSKHLKLKHNIDEGDINTFIPFLLKGYLSSGYIQDIEVVTPYGTHRLSKVCQPDEFIVVYELETNNRNWTTTEYIEVCYDEHYYVESLVTIDEDVVDHWIAVEQHGSCHKQYECSDQYEMYMSQERLNIAQKALEELIK